jgi:alpha-D-xyloside xylohydrolase
MLTRSLRSARILPLLLLIPSLAAARAQTIKNESGPATVVVETYAPNIVRVSISLLKPFAEAEPGYGIVAKADGTGWKRERSARGELLRSADMVVTTSVSDGKVHAHGDPG